MKTTDEVVTFLKKRIGEQERMEDDPRYSFTIALAIETAFQEVLAFIEEK